MYRAYLVIGTLIIVVFAVAQYLSWSFFTSNVQHDAQARPFVRGGTGSSYSGHK